MKDATPTTVVAGVHSSISASPFLTKKNTFNAELRTEENHFSVRNTEKARIADGAKFIKPTHTLQTGSIHEPSSKDERTLEEGGSPVGKRRSSSLSKTPGQSRDEARSRSTRIRLKKITANNVTQQNLDLGDEINKTFKVSQKELLKPQKQPFRRSIIKLPGLATICSPDQTTPITVLSQYEAFLNFRRE